MVQLGRRQLQVIRIGGGGRRFLDRGKFDAAWVLLSEDRSGNIFRVSVDAGHIVKGSETFKGWGRGSRFPRPCLQARTRTAAQGCALCTGRRKRKVLRHFGHGDSGLSVDRRRGSSGPRMTAASSRRTGSAISHGPARPAVSGSDTINHGRRRRTRRKNFSGGISATGAGGRRGAGAGGSPPGPAAGLEECQDSARPAAAAGDRDPRRWPAWISLPALEGPSRGKGPQASWRLRIALALCVRGSRPRRSRVLLLWTQRRIAGRETVSVSAFCFGAFPWRYHTTCGVDNRRCRGDFSALVGKISTVSRGKGYSLFKAQHCRRCGRRW